MGEKSVGATKRLRATCAGALLFTYTREVGDEGSYPLIKLGKIQIWVVVATSGRCGGGRRSGMVGYVDFGVRSEAFLCEDL